MNSTEKYSVLPELEELEHVLQAEAPERTELSVALAKIAGALRAHARDLDGSGGLLDEKDVAARPSLGRRAEQLRAQVSSLEADAEHLQHEVEAGHDDGELLHRTEELLQALRKHRDGEAGVLLESTQTEVGAGD
jgi:hypothetical protein